MGWCAEFSSPQEPTGNGKGDQAFIYHTGDEKSVVGIAQVSKAGYPEPKDAAWTAVDLIPVKALKNPVSLSAIKQDQKLKAMVLVKAARLSVQPVSPEEFEYIVELSKS